AAHGLGEVGADAVPALVDALGDKRAEVRLAAANVLGPLRVGDKLVVTALAYAVQNDADEQVRLAAVQALAPLGAAAKPAAAALSDALTDASGSVRQSAFYVLQSMGEDVRGGLLKALEHKDDRIR